MLLFQKNVLPLRENLLQTVTVDFQFCQERSIIIIYISALNIYQISKEIIGNESKHLLH